MFANGVTSATDELDLLYTTVRKPKEEGVAVILTLLELEKEGRLYVFQ